MNYEKLAMQVTQSISAIPDLPSGVWAMAVLSDILQSLAEGKNWASTFRVIETLCGSVNVELDFKESDTEAIQAFIFLFTDAVSEKIYST